MYFTDQNKIHVSHASTVSKELNPIIGYMKGSGYELTTDRDSHEGIVDASLIICLLTARLVVSCVYLDYVSIKNILRCKNHDAMMR